MRSTQRLFPFLLLSLACVAHQAPRQESSWDEQRKQMVETQLKSRDIDDARVLTAMGKVPRHEFVPEAARPFSYQDYPLAIGFEQTISQPYIVALMTQTARPEADDKALEIGTGSGYQAAVLSELVKQVFTIEIVPELAQRSTADLARLGYKNVTTRLGDGYQGWPTEAPFDLILVTAAADRIPQPLLDQLADGGRLVMPIGQFSGIQFLTLVTRNGDRYERERIAGVRFVPMTGKVREPR